MYHVGKALAGKKNRKKDQSNGWQGSTHITVCHWAEVSEMVDEPVHLSFNWYERPKVKIEKYTLNSFVATNFEQDQLNITATQTGPVG